MTATAAGRQVSSHRFAFRQSWRRGALVPYALIGPALACLLIFNVLSIVLAAGVSLTNLDIGGLADPSRVRFIGVANYRAMFTDPAFWEALRNTFLFVGLGVPTLVVGSLAIAIALN